MKSTKLLIAILAMVTLAGCGVNAGKSSPKEKEEDNALVGTTWMRNYGFESLEYRFISNDRVRETYRNPYDTQDRTPKILFYEYNPSAITIKSQGRLYVGTVNLEQGMLMLNGNIFTKQ